MQMTPRNNRFSATMLNKVPEVTIYFWIIKILCTTIGETASDYLNEKSRIWSDPNERGHERAARRHSASAVQGKKIQPSTLLDFRRDDQHRWHADHGQPVGQYRGAPRSVDHRVFGRSRHRLPHLVHIREDAFHTYNRDNQARGVLLAGHSVRPSRWVPRRETCQQSGCNLDIWCRFSYSAV